MISHIWSGEYGSYRHIYYATHIEPSIKANLRVNVTAFQSRKYNTGSIGSIVWKGVLQPPENSRTPYATYATYATRIIFPRYW